MSIAQNLQSLLEEMPQDVKLVAVSKTHPPETILEAYHAGHRLMGENKAQELIRKQPLLPDDIQWHFIGHLQSNKVKYMAPFVSMIESVDSLKLLKEINKQGRKVERKIDCLLQFHIAEEDTKFGLSLDEAREMLQSEVYKNASFVRLCGVMGMATFTEDKEQVRREFRQLKGFYDLLKKDFFVNDEAFNEISMGMSGDYREAIEEGATMVRIGSLIFGERNHIA